jgi:hypothetical protein
MVVVVAPTPESWRRCGMAALAEWRYANNDNGCLMPRVSLLVGLLANSQIVRLISRSQPDT